MNILERQLEPLEYAIRTELVPALTGSVPPGEMLRRVLALPCRLVGLDLIDPRTTCSQFQSSVRISTALPSRVLAGERSLGDAIASFRVRLKLRADKLKRLLLMPICRMRRHGRRVRLLG